MGYLAETVEIAKSMGTGTHQIVIQSGVLEGIMAKVTVEDLCHFLSCNLTNAVILFSLYIPFLM